jgi:type I restriction enzyme S subunit
MKTTSNDILPEGFKMTELGALPEEWKVVKLGEVADISSGGNAPQGDKYFNGDKPFVRVSHIDNQNYSVNKYDLINDNAINDYRLKLFPKDTIIFPKSGATVYLEKRAMLPIDAYVVSHLCTVISNKEEAIQHFLFYVLISLKLAKEKADGYPTLNISEVKRIPIPLPPLPEQQKIAAALSAVQEAKEKTEAVIAATKALKKSMMKHLFTYGPVSPEETETVLLKETEIGPVPEDWEVVRLGEVAEISSGGTPSRKRNEYWIDGNIPWIKSEQCHDCYISVANEYITDLGLEDSSAKMLKKGTVLLAMVGATIGKTGFLTFEACTNQNIAGIFPINSLNNLFLYYALQSRYNEFEKIKGYGIANLSYLRQFKIPLPPLPIQQKIASILSAIDAKIEAEENKKKALEELFKSLLHNLMTAKIRVNHLEINV